MKTSITKQIINMDSQVRNELIILLPQFSDTTKLTH